MDEVVKLEDHSSIRRPHCLDGSGGYVPRCLFDNLRLVAAPNPGVHLARATVRMPGTPPSDFTVGPLAPLTFAPPTTGVWAHDVASLAAIDGRQVIRRQAQQLGNSQPSSCARTLMVIMIGERIRSHSLQNHCRTLGNKIIVVVCFE